MRTLIINPPSWRGHKFIREGRCEQRQSSFQYMMVPISLPSIAAVLIKNGIKVKILDLNIKNMTLQEIKEEIKEFNPKLIIFNYSTATYHGDKEFTKAVRIFHKAHFTAIGVHITTLPEEVLCETVLDSVVRREPEITCLKLAQAIEKNKDLKKVLGISYKKNNMIIHNKDRPFIKNLDKLPFPARNLLENEKYTLPFYNRPYTLLVTSRGCPHNCSFCTAKLYYGERLRQRSAKNIVDEMEEIKNKYNIHYITMWSDTFTLDRKFVMDLCEEILKRKLIIKWMCNSRVDTVDEEMLKAMKKAGCIGIAFGVESGVQEILDKAGKKTTLKEIEKAFKLMKKVGIESLAHFIFGLPGETTKTIKKTVKFAKKLDPDYAQFYCAIPFPGTDFYKQAVNNNWLTTNDWSKYEINQAIINTPSLSIEELKRARKKAYQSFYLRPTYILKIILKIKSLKEFQKIFTQSINFVRDWVLKS